MDRYTAEFLTEQPRSRSETRYLLSRRGDLHILRWRGRWSFVYSRSGVCEVCCTL